MLFCPEIMLSYCIVQWDFLLNPFLGISSHLGLWSCASVHSSAAQPSTGQGHHGLFSLSSAHGRVDDFSLFAVNTGCCGHLRPRFLFLCVCDSPFCLLGL